MRVVVHLRAFFDHVPVPPGVAVSTEDIRNRKVMPGRDPGTWRMRVKRTLDTHNTALVPESEIAKWIVRCAMPQQGRQRLTRKQAVADYLAVRVYPLHCNPGDMVRFEVHDDGPEEKLFRETIAPYTVATDADGDPLIAPSDVEAMVKLYTETATSDDHEDHLHGRFNLPKKARS